MSEAKVDPVELVGPRRRRSAQERLQIVEESYVHGMSVTRVARNYGINANQVFQWRRLQQDGLLGPSVEKSVKLLPVSVIEERALAKPEALAAPACAGKIHIELPGRVSIRLEGDVDAATVRLILKSLRS